MLTVVAYLVTVILGQFAFKIGIIIGGLATLQINLLLDLLFSEKFSENIRLKAIPALLGFIGGIFPSFVCVAFGYLVFTLIAGSGTFGVFPFFASVVSMAFPIFNDFNRYREMQRLGAERGAEMEKEGFRSVDQFIVPRIYGRGFSTVGEIAGIPLSGMVLAFFMR